MKPSLYTRPAKPQTMLVRRRHGPEPIQRTSIREPVAVHGSTECHVTPPEQAEEMFSWLELEWWMSVLEPQAGTGNLLQPIIDSGHPLSMIKTVEREQSLCSTVRERFPELPVECECFLEYAASTSTRFDRIVMNPPFKKVRQHMAAALSLLKNNGRVVALVPITFEHESSVLVDILDNSTFALAKVNTKIIYIDKGVI